jgi:hypothetical protein
VSSRSPTGDALQSPEYGLLGLCAKAGKPPNLAASGRPTQVVYGANVQCLVERLDPFWPQPLNFHQVTQLTRRPRRHFVQQGQAPGTHDGLYFGGQILADIRQLAEIGVGLDEAGHGFGISPDRARRVAVGANTEGIGAFQFEQVGKALEQTRDFCIVYRHG